MEHKSSDVVVYARHSRGCTNTTTRKLKKCACPKWLYIKSSRKRISARTTSWESAEIEAQKIRDSYDPDKVRIAELEAKLRDAGDGDRKRTIGLMVAILVQGRSRRDGAIDECIRLAERIMKRIDGAPGR